MANESRAGRPPGDGRHTLPMDDPRGQAGPRGARDQVVGLYRQPSGPHFALAGFTNSEGDGAAQRFIAVGARATSDIVLDHATVSSAHCLIERGDAGVKVHDCGSTNGTRVNGVRVAVSQLYPGNVLQLGAESLYVYGVEGFEAPRPIVARSLYTFVHVANRLYDSMTAAGLAVGMAPRTFIRWVTVKYKDRPPKPEQKKKQKPQKQKPQKQKPQKQKPQKQKPQKQKQKQKPRKQQKRPSRRS